MNKLNTWEFVGGGECKDCHRPEMTELDKYKVCYECWVNLGYSLEVEK